MVASGKDPKLEKEKSSYKDDSIFEIVWNKALETKHPSKPNGWTDGNYKKYVSLYNLSSEF